MTRCHGWDHQRDTDLVEAEIARFADVVRGADLGLPVPTCPEWTLADLVDHAGTVHRWAGHMVRNLSAERATGSDLELDVPDDPAGYPAWLAAGGAVLAGALRAANGDEPMWSWGADQHARFWSRRMLHETTVHRADAEVALGTTPTIDAAVAVDGIDELLDNLPCAVYFAPNVAELRGDDETLGLRATDTGDQWRILLAPDGFTWRHDDGVANALVEAPAAGLLLLAYGRRQPDDDGIVVSGDRALLDRWLVKSSI